MKFKRRNLSNLATTKLLINCKNKNETFDIKLILLDLIHVFSEFNSSMILNTIHNKFIHHKNLTKKFEKIKEEENEVVLKEILKDIRQTLQTFCFSSK